MEDAAEPAAAEPEALGVEGMDEAPAEGMDAAARLGLPVKTAEDEAKEKEDAELRDLKKQVLEEEKRKRAERFNMEVEEPEKKDEEQARLRTHSLQYRKRPNRHATPRGA